MKTHFLNLILFFFILLTENSYGNSPVYEREYSVRNSTNTVLAIKIDGRIDCSALAAYPQKNVGGHCDNVSVSDDMKSYNLKKSTEDFLVLRSFVGNKVQGDIIKVKLDQAGYDFGSLMTGQAYVIFFHEESGEYKYEHCDAIPYNKIKAILDKKISYEKMIELILEKEIMECPTFIKG